MSFWKAIAGGLSNTAEKEKNQFKPEHFRAPQRLKDGYVWSEKMILPRPCTIRDLSPLTAQVILWEDDVKPAQLTGRLVIYSSADRKEADCTLEQRNGKTLNLRLSGPFRAPTRSYSKR